MSEKVKDFLFGTLFVIVITLAMGGCIWYGTSAEVWYAGMHDSKCENTLHGKRCYCYERFVEADKERAGK